MKLTFTKRNGKYDDLVVEAANIEFIQCPKQGIIPHDMVHYAVESILCHRGFLNSLLVADASTEIEAVERLVEVFQAEMWNERVSSEDFIAVYEHACSSRNHAISPVSTSDIEAVRDCLDDLTVKWTALPVGQSLTLELLS